MNILLYKVLYSFQTPFTTFVLFAPHKILWRNQEDLIIGFKL